MSEPEEEIRVNLPIDWHIPENLQSQYASNVFVQPGEYEIVLSFFETRAPVLTGSPEENLTKLKKLESVQAKCVARIIVAPDLVPKLIQALQNGLDGYLAIRELLEKEGNK